MLDYYKISAATTVEVSRGSNLKEITNPTGPVAVQNGTEVWRPGFTR